MNISELLDDAAARLRTAGIESPRLEARLLLAHAMGVKAEELVSGSSPAQRERGTAQSAVEGEATSTEPAASPSTGIAALAGLPPPFRSAHGGGTDCAERFNELLARRLAREPLAYIVGKKEFWSLDFAVGPGVLVPRPESETLVEEALRITDRDARLSVLDLGTGSGCLLLAFLSERHNARGLGIDGSKAALDYARANANQLHLADRVTFQLGDWADEIKELFDIILVNPPYLTDAELAAAPPELRVEPRVALAGGADGLDAYRALAAQLPALLSGKGRALVEIGQGQADTVETIFSSAGLETERRVPDLTGIPRCLVLAARGA